MPTTSAGRAPRTDGWAAQVRRWQGDEEQAAWVRRCQGPGGERRRDSGQGRL